MERLSPELILVDPDLARIARRELRDPDDCLERRSRPRGSTAAAASSERAVAMETRAHGASRAERPLPSFLAVLGALLTALVIGSPLLDLLPVEVERPSFAPRTGDPPRIAASGTSNERSGRIRLRWRKVRGADFYDLVLWRDGQRVTDLWPKTNGIAIDVAGGEETTLSPGTYKWFAFPAFKDAESTRFGPYVARGEFRVE